MEGSRGISREFQPINACYYQNPPDCGHLTYLAVPFMNLEVCALV